MGKRAVQYQGNSLLESLVCWGIVGLFAVLPLLYFPGRIASYVTSKQYFLIGTVDILAALWSWLLLADRRYRLSRRNMLLLAPLFLFLLSLTVSALTGVDSATSFYSTVESGTGLILLYHVFLLACIIASLIRVQQKQFLKYILQANLFASTVLAALTFFTGPNGLVDLNSSMLNGSSGGAMMGNSLLAGAYFVFSLFLALYLVVHESALWKKAAYWFGIAMILFSPIYFNVAIFKGAAISFSYFFLGQARVATVAVMAGLLLSLFIWLCTKKNSKVLRAFGIAGIVLAVLAGGIILKKITTTGTSLNVFFVKESGNRIVDWQASVQAIREKPLLGWGPENFHVVYQQFFNPIVLSPERGKEAWALHPHNNTLEVLVNGGVIGFASYLAVLVSMFGGLFVLYRKGRIDGKTYALLTGMLAALIIQQQMIYDSIVSYAMFFLIGAVIAGLYDVTDQSRAVRVPVDATGYAIGIAVAALAVPAFVYGAYLPARKMEEFHRTAEMTSDKRAGQYQHLFHSVGSYAIDTDAEFYTDPLFYSYDAQKDGLKSNPLYQKVASQEIQALLDAVDPVWQIQAKDYHLTLSLINLENLEFYLTGDAKALAQADGYAKRAFQLSPADPQIYTAYAQTLAYEKNSDGAKMLLDRAIELNPSYQPAVEYRKMFK